MESSRQTWSDARMDEFAQRTEMNERFALLEAKLDRRFDTLFGALATGFIAAVVQHFIG